MNGETVSLGARLKIDRQITRLPLAVACLSWAMFTPMAASAQAMLELASPDGSITLRIDAPADGPPRYTVVRKGETVIAPSPLGIVYADGSRTDALILTQAAHTSVDRQVPLVATKAAVARDHYNQLAVSLADPAGAGPPIELDLRAYDDGVALRYRLRGTSRPITIAGERTGFYLPADMPCWGSALDGYTTSHEGLFKRFSPAAQRTGQLYDTGLLCKTPGGGTSLIFAEAGLADYSGLYLRARADGGIGFDAALAPYPGDPQVAVRAEPGRDVTTPWRVMLMADRAGDLIPSTTIGNLNPDPVGDWSWVQPGKAAWDWWSGPYFPDLPEGPTNMVGLERLIDFAGQSGFRYMLIDEGWADKPPAKGSAPADPDIMRAKPDIDMPALVAYARARNVDLLLWAQWNLLDPRVDEVLDQYARWGIKGIKVDFMNRNDQGMVAFYHRVLAAAAQRHLLVDFHSAYQPTGLQRTWPNYITQEGVMAAEYNRWSKSITATHNVSLAFTRMVLGPMDYTPGGFRNRTPADFRNSNRPPQVQTTRGAALAMFVVYESPLQMVADSPDAYAGVPEFGFIRDVPADWDETVFVDGDIDSHVVLARRKGDDWFVGAMTNETARRVTVPLGFLGKGRFDAEIWQDGASVTQVVRDDRSVRSSDAISLALAASGGAVVHLRPHR